MKRPCAFCLALLAVILATPLSAATPPTDLPGLRYTNAFFPGVTYDAGIPSPESLLGFAIGERAANSIEIERCLKAWTNAAPDRTRLVEYARSHENRPLHYLVITAPTNRARLDEIQAGLSKLGDPRKTTDAEAQQLIARLPAVAWLAYTIHGDETEGSDAALAVIHHLLAAQDPQVRRLLDDLVIIIDPVMNPDGRDRFVKMIAEHRGTAPSVDDQSLLHSGYWPRGRGNHYLFDLNRDWLTAEHPESRGRIREVGRWNPVLFVDAHGMGGQDTHLFSPPREPINPNIPTRRRAWSEPFARDQARAFDQRGLLYYSGEWHEEWFPGYSDAWASYRGAVGILYEQARIAEDGVRRPEGRILSYRESILHHVTGSLANLTTAAANAKKLLADLYATRKEALDPAGPYGKRTFAVPPTTDQSRLREFVALLQLQGFEVFTAPHEIAVSNAADQLGREMKDAKLPAGTLLIPNRQPLGHLLAAFLEFDPRFSPKVLEDERKELLRLGRSRIYDTTAWNLTMMFGLEALTLPTDLPADAKPWTASEPQGGITGTAPSPAAWVFDGADDLSVTAAARLMERGVQVRVAEKDFQFDGRAFARGSVLVTPLDNRTFTGDVGAAVKQTSTELGLPAVAVVSGFGPGDLPDIGGGWFHRLEPPRIATLTRDGFSSGDYGAIWFTLDHRLGIRHSQLDAGPGADLTRYNVLILPERGRGGASDLPATLKDWVRNGGTLIAIGSAATPFIGEKAEFSQVRALPDVLGRLADYEIAILREWQGRVGTLPAPDRIWAHLVATKLEYPWQIVDGPHPDEKELKKRDAWQALFMPEGAFLAARIDTNHWLTAGCDEPFPVLMNRAPVLMAGDGVEAPIRLGFLTASTSTNSADAVKTNLPPAAAEGAKSSADADKKEKKEPPRAGWCSLPPGTEMHLRMSGLLWPEAAHRLANAAWVTRERLGRGQIIFFASPPTFRAATRGTTRVFLNAVVCGPGFGSAPVIRP